MSKPPQAGFQRPRSESSEPPPKRAKKEGFSQSLLEQAQMLKDAIGELKPLLQEMQEVDIDTRPFRICFIAWEFELNMTFRNVPWPLEACGILDHLLPVPEGLRDEWKELVHTANDIYSEYRNLQKEAIAVAAVALPPPSVFAETSVWPSVQEKLDHLRCLRPTERTGLPLSTLHTVFPAFLDRIDQPVPKNTTGHAALRAASALCKSMGQPFDNKYQRGNEFDACVSGLFTWPTTFKSGVSSSRDTSEAVPDRVYFGDKKRSIPIAVREDKSELGEGGSDVYLQTVRSYDVLVNQLRDKKTKAATTFLKCGAPMFLLSVIGPLIFVAGGFFDGDTVTVEPLGESRFMLKDYTGGRQQSLGQLLYALQIGMEDLSRIPEMPFTANFPPGVPRLYTSITSPVDFPKNELKFRGPIDHGTATTPIFFATLLVPQKEPHMPDWIPVVVKLAPGRYGGDVQRLLYDKNLAPQYYGSTTLDHAPTAHVMERLTEPWISLSDFERLPSADVKWKGAIWRRLQRALSIMTKNNVVHGDLRSNNIFIEIHQESKEPVLLANGSVNLKVLDFDWAGKAGEVRYPATRNDDIQGIMWPGSAGSIIGPEDDGLLVASWWPVYLEKQIC